MAWYCWIIFWNDKTLFLDFFAMLQKYLSQCDTYFKFAESKNKFYFYSFIDTLYIGSDVVKMVFYLFFPEFCLFLRDLPHSLMQKKKKSSI